MVRLVSPAALAVLTLLAAAPAAWAHGEEQGADSGYVATFSNVEPLVLGVQVTITHGDELVLTNLSGKTVVVLGNEGEPYLRFGPGGVYRNTRSPTTYANLAEGEKLELPPGTSSTAPPRWEKAGSGQSFKWHERRIGWSDTRPPDAVARQPRRPHFIGYWQIPATADGEPFAIKGFLGYVPPPPKAASGGSSTGTAVAALAGFGVAAAAASVLLLRRRRAATTPHKG